MSDHPELDALFSVARQHIRALTATRQPKRATTPDTINPDTLFTNPDNWTRNGAVALIHTETETLLGTFIEYLHNTERHARRLVREEGVVAVNRTEHVSGDWWIAEQHDVAPVQVWHEKRPLILEQLVLDKLYVHSPLCEVVVHLSYGSIARVELAVETQFAQLDATKEQLLWLPSGANILPCMSRDAKIALHVQLEKPE